jgi:NAD(P)-dependent dehydrogenase (short-subunit alcohol dehydrogenase family)
MADTDRFPALADDVAREEDHLDVVINVAGVYSRFSAAWNPETTGFDALDADDLAYVFRVNSIAPVLLGKALTPLLSRAPRGRLVNLSSLLGSVGHKTSGADYAYCASKAALNIMTRALAVDLAPKGIIALAMTPGWVKTDMGGENAMLTPEESVRGMLGVVERMTPADAGRFVDQEGVDQPW